MIVIVRHRSLTAIVGEVDLDDALGGGDANVGRMPVLREGFVVHLRPAIQFHIMP